MCSVEAYAPCTNAVALQRAVHAMASQTVVCFIYNGTRHQKRGTFASRFCLYNDLAHAHCCQTKPDPLP